jgi:biopolymer transport protein ExbD
MSMTTGGGGLRAEMNVTPMIDVLLVLIIIFLMITPLAPTKGEDALIPQPAPNDANIPPPDATIVVQLLTAPEGQRPLLKITQRDVTWEKLEPTLKEIFIRRADKVAFVKADRELNFEDVAQIIGIAHQAGVISIGLMTERRI